jgi:hypothetical protein
MAFGWMVGLPKLLGVHKRAHVIFLFLLHALDRSDTGAKSCYNTKNDGSKESNLHQP